MQRLSTCRLRRCLLATALVGALSAPAAPARGQAFNIDFGGPASKPADTYAAAGLPGVWNSVMGDSSMTYPLVGLDGRPTSVTLSQSGATSFLSASDPSVSGDDAALLNDALITTDPTNEVCLFIHGLQPATYEVLVYAWMPNAPSVKSRVRQDLATMTIDVGGAWTGSHVEGVTYARHMLQIDSAGFLGSHSGIVPGALAANGAALNGIQIRPLVPGGPDAGGGSQPDAGPDARPAPPPDAAADGRTSGPEAGPPSGGGGPNPESGSCAVAGAGSGGWKGMAGVFFFGILLGSGPRRRTRA